MKNHKSSNFIAIKLLRKVIKNGLAGYSKLELVDGMIMIIIGGFAGCE